MQSPHQAGSCLLETNDPSNQVTSGDDKRDDCFTFERLPDRAGWANWRRTEGDADQPADSPAPAARVTGGVTTLLMLAIALLGVGLGVYSGGYLRRRGGSLLPPAVRSDGLQMGYMRHEDVLPDME